MIVSTVDRLVEENMGLVSMVAKRYMGHGTDYEDLFQIGALGLVKAAKRFDHSKNLKFSTYAVALIAGEIKTYFRDNGAVKISRGIKEKILKVKRAHDQLLTSLGRGPTVEEISAVTDLCVEDIIECLEIKESVLSLDKESEEGGSLHDMLGVNNEESALWRITVRQALEKLESRERQVIVMRYFMDKTQSEVARALNITQVSVSRMEKNILKKLAKMIS